MDAVQTMLDAIAADPADDAAWLALADCLEDAGRFAEAEVARLREILRHAALDDPQRGPNERRMQQLLADGVRPISPVMRLPLRGETEMEFRLIPPGVFWSGSPPDEPGRTADEPLRARLYMTAGFWMGTYPVTQRQWGALTEMAPPSWREGQRPAVHLGWEECIDVALELCHRTGRAVGIPSEEQWEYACRAATTSLCHGGGLDTIPFVAWCAYGEGPSQPKPVGQYAPNAFGLHDLHGNVWEWTSTTHRWLDAEQTIPNTGWLREVIVRGGSFRALPARCRSAARAVVQETASDDIGCRLVVDLSWADVVSRQ